MNKQKIYKDYFKKFCDQAKENEDQFDTENYPDMKSTIRGSVVTIDDVPYLFIFHHQLAATELQLCAYNAETKQVEVASRIELDLQTIKNGLYCAYPECIVDDFEVGKGYENMGLDTYIYNAGKQLVANVSIEQIEHGMQPCTKLVYNDGREESIDYNAEYSSLSWELLNPSTQSNCTELDGSKEFIESPAPRPTQTPKQ